jgi:hypothetical protein
MRDVGLIIASHVAAFVMGALSALIYARRV